LKPGAPCRSLPAPPTSTYDAAGITAPGGGANALELLAGMAARRGARQRDRGLSGEGVGHPADGQLTSSVEL
jgi:hypothetical protein